MLHVKKSVALGLPYLKDNSKFLQKLRKMGPRRALNALKNYKKVNNGRRYQVSEDEHSEIVGKSHLSEAALRCSCNNFL